jgi:hypothetical protein
MSHKKRMFPGRDLHHLSHNVVLNHIGAGADPYEDPPAMRYDESRNANPLTAPYKSAPNNGGSVSIILIDL